MQITVRAPAQVPPPSARPPLLGVTPEDVAAVHDELLAYHAAFAAHFRRAEQRHWALKYTEGQLLPLERTPIAPLADALDGGNVQALQHRPGGTRRDRGLGCRGGARHPPATRGRDAGRCGHGRADRGWLRLPQAGQALGRGGAAPPRGHPAARWGRSPTARPAWSPPPSGHPASARGYALVDRRRYLPEAWFAEEARDRRRRCGVPADTRFQTRPALTWALLAGLRERAVLPFRWVTGDEHFGNTPPLLDRIAAAGLASCMAVPHNVRVWPPRPATAVPPATGRQGAPCTRLRLAPDAPAPLRVAALAAQVPPRAWQVAQIQEGRTGPLLAEVAFVRAVAVRDGLPGPDVWLVLRRPLDAPTELKAYRCNAAPDTAPETLIWLLGRRWPVEQASQEGKEELGLDHDAVRGWPGHPRAGRAPPHDDDAPGPGLPHPAAQPGGGGPARR